MQMRLALPPAPCPFTIEIVCSEVNMEPNQRLRSDHRQPGSNGVGLRNFRIVDQPPKTKMGLVFLPVYAYSEPLDLTTSVNAHRVRQTRTLPAYRCRHPCRNGRVVFNRHSEGCRSYRSGTNSSSGRFRECAAELFHAYDVHNARWKDACDILPWCDL
jgi:hypothetical protein